MATEPSRGEANRLYWETDAPVGRIAETLGISRRALYELLERIPADAPCPECGGPVLFANRLARSTGEAQCGVCGASTVLTPGERPRDPDARLAEAAAAAAVGSSNGGNRTGEDGLYPAWTYAPEPPRRKLADLLGDRRVLAIAGIALAGVLVGVGATLLIRRRRRR